jgi:hypothetical protein
VGKIAFVIFVLYASAGCRVVYTNRFRVVDAVDGQPLANVEAEGNNDMYQPSNFLGWPVLCRSDRHYSISDPSGLVKFDNMQGEVTFKENGYEPCTVVADSPGYRQRNKLFGRLTFSWEDERTVRIELQPSKGVRGQSRRDVSH